MKNEPDDFYSLTEPQPGIVYNEKEPTCISLHKCVSGVIDGLQSNITANSNSIANDVFPKLIVSTDKQTLISVLESLLHIVITNSQNNSIYVSAKVIGSITLIHIRSSNAEYNDSIGNGMQKIEQMAESIGGCLTISNNKMHGLTLAFTFINR
ncbi:MAG: hypothetical protein JJE22_15665 [Bacteroidia bacterium]|nr:hypothetical protein [Bacteroidia bacterium]